MVGARRSRQSSTQARSCLSSGANIRSPSILVTAVLFVVFGHAWRPTTSVRRVAAIIFAWLFCFIIWGAINVVRHADHLADLLGEPFGTLILTLSVTSIEIVTVAIVMLTGPTTRRWAATRCSPWS